MRRGFTLIQIILGLAAVAIVATAIVYTAQRFSKQPAPAANTNAVACTADAKQCPDGSSVSRVPPSCEFAACPATNANAAVNVNAAANTNTAVTNINPTNDSQIGENSLLAIATSGGGNTKRIFKIDPTTGSVVKETSFTPELAFGGGRFSSFNASNSVQFGADGDSVIFYQGIAPDMGGSGSNSSGLYRTRFSAPGTFDTVVVYQNSDTEQVTITNWLYDSVHHQIVYVLSRQTFSPSTETFSLMAVDTETKGARKVASLSVKPYITFLGHDASTVTNFYWDNPSRPQAGYVEQIRLSDGQITRTTLFQGKVFQSISPVEDSLSPNQQLFMSWFDQSLYSLKLPNLQVATRTSLGKVNNIGLLWSPNSQLTLLTVRDESKPYRPTIGEVHAKQLVYNVSTERVEDTLENGSFPFLWSPGSYAIYWYHDPINTTIDSVRAYNPATKKSVVLQLEKKLTPDNILGMNWVAQ